MSKERELLRRALEEWDIPKHRSDKWFSLFEEIRAHLAAEEQYDALRDNYVEGLGSSMTRYVEAMDALCDEADKLLTAEQRKPLTEEMDKGYEEWMSEPSWACFVLGVRFAEKHHGISEDQ